MAATVEKHNHCHITINSLFNVCLLLWVKRFSSPNIHLHHSHARLELRLARWSVKNLLASAQAQAITLTLHIYLLGLFERLFGRVSVMTSVNAQGLPSDTNINQISAD